MNLSHSQLLLNRTSISQLEEIMVPEKTVRIHFFMDVSTRTLHDYTESMGSIEDAVTELMAEGGYVVTGAEVPDTILNEEDEGGTDGEK